MNHKRNGRGSKSLPPNSLGTQVKFDGMRHQRDRKLSRVALLRKYTYGGNILALIVNHALVLASMNTYDPCRQRVGQTLTGVLWGEDLGTETQFKLDGLKSVAMLQDVEARGKNPPPRRPPVCSENGYAEWDRIGDSIERGISEFPKEHALVIHTTIAKRKSSGSPSFTGPVSLSILKQTVWKDSIIKPSWSSSDHYTAFAARDSDKGGYDMYIDYRTLAPNWVSSRTDIDLALEVPPTSRECFGGLPR